MPDFPSDFILMIGGQVAGMAGLYPLDAKHFYYFFGFPVSQVCGCPGI